MMNKELFIFIVIFIIFFYIINNLPIIEGKRGKKNKNIFKSKKFKKMIAKKKRKPKKKSKPKKKRKPKPFKMELKPAASADYSDNIVPPYSGNEYNKIKNDVLEYDKALSGDKSSKLVSGAPLGKLYFYNTGVKCNYGGKQVDRYSIIDSRQGVFSNNIMDFSSNSTNVVNSKTSTLDKSMFASAIADFNRSTIFKDKPNYRKTLADKCIPVTLEPVDVYGQKQAAQTHHVSVFDVKHFNKMQGIEKFETLDKIQTMDKRILVLPDLKKMNVGQQFFIGSTAFLGLYLFYEALYGK